MAKSPARIAVDRYIADELTRMNDAGTSWRDLGRTYRISHVHAQQVAGGKGAGPKLEATWAEKHFGGSVDELRRTAEAWARDRGVWETAAPMVLADPRAWLYDLPLEHVRMRPALEMALDAGIPQAFLRSFVERHDETPHDLGAAQWWTLIQGEWSLEQAPPERESPAHQQLRAIAHAETEAGRKVPEDVIEALKARFAETPEGGWLPAIKREIISQLGRGHRAQARADRLAEERTTAARVPARKPVHDGAAARKRAR